MTDFERIFMCFMYFSILIKHLWFPVTFSSTCSYHKNVRSLRDFPLNIVTQCFDFSRSTADGSAAPSVIAIKGSDKGDVMSRRKQC